MCSLILLPRKFKYQIIQKTRTKHKIFNTVTVGLGLVFGNMGLYLRRSTFFTARRIFRFMLLLRILAKRAERTLRKL